MAGSPRSKHRRAGPGFFDEKSVPTAGWLLKKGGRKTGRFLTPWKKRWFIFTPATKELRYLEAPSAAKASRSRHKQVLRAFQANPCLTPPQSHQQVWTGSGKL